METAANRMMKDGKYRVLEATSRVLQEAKAARNGNAIVPAIVPLPTGPRPVSNAVVGQTALLFGQHSTIFKESLESWKEDKRDYEAGGEAFGALYELCSMSVQTSATKAGIQADNPGALYDFIHARYLGNAPARLADNKAKLEKFRCSGLANHKVDAAKLEILMRAYRTSGGQLSLAQELAKIVETFSETDSGEDTQLSISLNMWHSLPGQTAHGLLLAIETHPNVKKAESALQSQANAVVGKRQRDPQDEGTSADAKKIKVLMAEVKSIQLRSKKFGKGKFSKARGKGKTFDFPKATPATHFPEVHEKLTCCGKKGTHRPHVCSSKVSGNSVTTSEKPASDDARSPDPDFVHAMSVTMSELSGSMEKTLLYSPPRPIPHPIVTDFITQKKSRKRRSSRIVRQYSAGQPLSPLSMARPTGRLTRKSLMKFRDVESESPPGVSGNAVVIEDTPNVGINSLSSYSPYFTFKLVIDSGASQHVVGQTQFVHPSKLTKKFYKANVILEVASGHKLSAKQKGYLHISNDSASFSIGDVIMVPGLTKNLLSVGALAKKGCKISFNEQSCEIVHPSGSKLFGRKEPDGLYYVEGDAAIYDQNLSQAAEVSEPDDSKSNQILLIKPKNQDALDLWHLRFCHLSYGYLEKAVDNTLVTDLDINVNFKKDILNPHCDDCEMGKSHKTSGSGGSIDRLASKNGERFYTDLCGPFSTQSKRGKKYFMTMIDAHSGFNHIYFLRRKSEFYDMFVQQDKLIFNRYGHHIKFFRHDNAKEMVCSRLKQYCIDNGIISNPTNTYSSWENAVAERKNRTLMEAARSQLFSSQKPKNLWEDSVATANYVQNRTPSRSNPGWATPYQMKENRKPSVKHFRVFGCDAMVHIPSAKVANKLMPRSIKATFVGYNIEGPTVSYRFITESGKYMVSGNATFNELPILHRHNSSLKEEEKSIKREDYTDLFSPEIPFTEDSEISESPRKRVKFAENSCEHREIIQTRLRTKLKEMASSRDRQQAARPLSKSPPDKPVVFPHAAEVQHPGSIEHINPYLNPFLPRSSTADARDDSEWSQLPQSTLGHNNSQAVLQHQGVSTSPQDQLGGHYPGTQLTPAPVDLNDPSPDAHIPSNVADPLDCPDSGVKDTFDEEAHVEPTEDNFNVLLANYLSIDCELDEKSKEKEEQTQCHLLNILACMTSARDTLETEPLTYEEAANSGDREAWLDSMNSELQSIEENKTWELVDLPEGKRALGTKWVFKYKLDGQGKVIRYKSRVVVQGWAQREGIDYNETFAPVARYGSVRLLLAIAAAKGWDVEQLDVKTAFLHGEIDMPDIYVKQPKGFVKKGQESKVYRLLRSLYGLKQAPRIFNQVVHAAFTKNLGFTQSKRDPCVYSKITEDEVTILIVFVDDIIITSSRSSHDYYEQLKASGLDIVKLGSLAYFLGIRINRNMITGELSLDQEAYIDRFLDKFGMLTCSGQSTPIDNSVPLSKEMCPDTFEEKRLMEKHPYREAIGSLMYLAVSTRPDLAKAISNVSKYLDNPGELHWRAVKRILRYVKHTKHLKLILGGKDIPLVLNCYADADLGGDLDKRRSTSGYIVMLGNSPIIWKSRLQTSTARSTTEAEYLSVSDLTGEILYFLPMLGEMDIPATGPVVVKEDNQGCIAISNNPTLNSRSKHIDIRHHVVRDLVDDGTIKLEYCPTKMMVADILTKGLPKATHWHILPLLNLRNKL